MENIYFAKFSPKAIIPSKREEDAAYDIYPCFEEDYIAIHPNETKMVPTGLISAFSSRYVALLKERGSTGTKGIGQRAGVIDSGYRGQWFIPITNHNNHLLIIKKEDSWFTEDAHNCIIYPYEKAICQCIMVEVPTLIIEELSVEDILKINSERGNGALGSSGK